MLLLASLDKLPFPILIAPMQVVVQAQEKPELKLINPCVLSVSDVMLSFPVTGELSSLTCFSFGFSDRSSLRRLNLRTEGTEHFHFQEMLVPEQNKHSSCLIPAQ